MKVNRIPEAFATPIRLAIISCLVNGEKTFTELKHMTESSDGNLSVQLSKLEEWGFIKSTKQFKNKKPVTTYNITKIGIEQLKMYVELLNEIITDEKK